MKSILEQLYDGEIHPAAYFSQNRRITMRWYMNTVGNIRN